MREAIIAHQSSDLLKAKEKYNRILEVDPNHPDANHNLGVIQATQGKLESAEILFSRALGANPDFAPYWQSYIKVHISMGKILEAEKYLDQANKKGLAQTDLKELRGYLTDVSATNKSRTQNNEKKGHQLPEARKSELDSLMTKKNSENC